MPEDLSCTITDEPDMKKPLIRIRSINPLNPHSWEGFVKYPFIIIEKLACEDEATYQITLNSRDVTVPEAGYLIYDNGLHSVIYHP